MAADANIHVQSSENPTVVRHKRVLRVVAHAGMTGGTVQRGGMAPQVGK